jgi:SNF2 family DNA or RNA helicase
LEANAKERFLLRAATEEEAARQSQMERYFDNAKFQRFEYHDACKALDILNLVRSRFLGMPTTMIFRSWQVVGIRALLDFERDPAIRVEILADAASLGKTIQIISYCQKVFDYCTIAYLDSYHILTQPPDRETNKKCSIMMFSAQSGKARTYEPRCFLDNHKY